MILCYNINVVSIGCHGHLPEAVKEVFFEINLNQNIETLYLLSALKEPVQIDYKKAWSVMG